jgi:hypothetical protein
MGVDQFFDAVRMSRPQIWTMALQRDNCCRSYGPQIRRPEFVRNDDRIKANCRSTLLKTFTTEHEFPAPRRGANQKRLAKWRCTPTGVSSLTCRVLIENPALSAKRPLALAEGTLKQLHSLHTSTTNATA